MENGRIQQEGDVSTLYDMPSSKFVASFMGQARFIEGKVFDTQEDHPLGCLVTSDGLRIWARADTIDKADNAFAAIRPEAIRLLPADSEHGDEGNVYHGTVERMTRFGDHTDYEVRIGNWPLHSKVLSCEHNFQSGAKVKIFIDPWRCALVLDREDHFD
jgi:ABC-type Fe3+/spermidine/putrescine transport system ATPase subunit